MHALIPRLLTTLVLLLPGVAWPQFDSFGYQLQNVDPLELAGSSLGLLIIDYSLDGGQEQALTREDIATIKAATGKKVVAYLSIGEAENYRYYFKRAWISAGACPRKPARGAPAWLDRENRAWCGNFKVRYWDKQWKKILYGVTTGTTESYLDRIMDAGFDGVYLDIIDGFEYWLYDKPKAQRRKSAASDMAQLVIDLARYARGTREVTDFLVIPQNGEDIINQISPALRAQYLGAIDGIGSEDAFFPGNRPENNTFSPQDPVLSTLELYRQAGKTVLSIEYLTEPDKIEAFRQAACDRGFIPQISHRDLDSIQWNTLPGCR